MNPTIGSLSKVKDLFDKLKREISTNINKKSLINVKELILDFKIELNNISLDLNLELQEKLDFYFTILHPLFELPNKFQAYRKLADNSLELVDELEQELLILCQFIIWTVVNNSHQQYQYRVQISANLLVKLLEAQSFQVPFEKFPITSESDLDRFGRVFNYQQTSGGLYKSAIKYLNRYHHDNAIDWINKAVIHFDNVLKLLLELDLENLYAIVQHSEKRNFFQLITVLSWPIYEFLDFFISVNEVFGPLWHKKITYNKEQIVQIFVNNVNVITHRVEEIKVKIKNFIGYDNLEETTKHLFNFNAIIIFIENYKLTTEILDDLVINGHKISNMKLLNYFNSVKEFLELAKNNSTQTLINQQITKSLEILLILSSISDIDHNELKLITTMIEEHLNENGGQRDYSLNLLYSIMKFNLIKTEEIEEDMNQHLNYLETSIEKQRFISIDSFMLTLLYYLIQSDCLDDKTRYREFVEGLDKKELESLGIELELFERYNTFVFGNNNDNFDEFHKYERNPWDWRTWILPEVKYYFPFNSKQFKVQN